MSGGVAASGTALVTGSTRGIGRAIALRLAGEGYTVALNYANDDPAAERTLVEVRARSRASFAIRADVCRPAGCDLLLRQTLERLEHLDVLVNNVGPWLERPLAETSDDEWRLLVDGNLGSAFWCVRGALPGMRRRRSGCIVNVSALNAEVSPGMPLEAPAYFAAKSALAMMTRALARSEGPHNIRVNAVSPGFIETENYAGWDPDAQDRCRAAVPLGRFGRPDEVADAVAFLVSARASYISGAILHVHGGLWV